MKEFYRLRAKRVPTSLLVSVLIIVYGSAVSDARFLDRRYAKMRPRLRLGCYPTSTLGTKYLNPEDLGSHQYRFNFSEQNGIVYTCNAGHIDIAHVRIAADWTAFLTAKTFDCLTKNDSGFWFKLQVDHSSHFVQFVYPESWKYLPRKNKEQIARELSIKLGQYFAYTMTTWHEMLTWFGYKCIGFFPEFPSAFSWEDSFSNLLGTHIGAQALRDTDHEFNEAMTLAIDRELKKLGVKPSHVARLAADNVRGEWFSGRLLFLVSMKMRNFDIGLDDGYVKPAIVPSLRGCEEAEARSYPVPGCDFLSEYGFSMKYEIEPREWEKAKILKVVYPNPGGGKKRIEPAVHFARIMDYIRQDAVRKYGEDLGGGQGQDADR